MYDLIIPRTEIVDGCEGYWCVNSGSPWKAMYDGTMIQVNGEETNLALRPLMMIPLNFQVVKEGNAWKMVLE